MPEHTRREVERAAKRQGKSFSATVTDLVEKQLASEPKVSPFEALIGAISDPRLQAADMDDVLRESWADAIERDRR